MLAGPLRTLYVNRPVLNAADILAWAATIGLPSTVAPSDLHVTVAFSRAPLDWTQHPPLHEPLTVMGGVRQVTQFSKATVLRFESTILAGRWRELRAAGASWDHPSYHPHITLSYATPPGFDPAAVAAWRGAVVLGGERFAPLDLDWKAKVAEAPARAPAAAA